MIWAVCLLLVALVAPSVTAEDDVAGAMEGVKELSSVGEITSGKWFVLYYNPDCGFCKRVAAEWKKLGLDHPGDVTVAKLNAGRHKAPSSVTGYPTIMLYIYNDNNEMVSEVEYDNHPNRDWSHFVDFLNDSPTSLPKDSVSQNEHPTEAPVWYYIWYSDIEKASEALNSQQVAELVQNGEIKPTTLMAKAGDTEWTEAAVLEFVGRLFTDGDVVDLSDSTFESRTSDGRFWMVAVVVPECGFCKRLAPEWEALGSHYKDSVEVAVGRVNAELSPQTSSLLDASGFPTIICITPSGRRVQFTDHPNRHKERFISFIQDLQRQYDDEDEEL